MYLTVSTIVGTSTKSVYVPVPKAGRIRGFQATWNKSVAQDDTISLKKGTDEVNALTVGSDNTAAGSVVRGTPNTNNKNLIFAVGDAIKVDVSALSSSDTEVTLVIDFDEFGIPDRN
jgi:hypothetical protein